jgi:hypothetical protein
MNTQAGTSLQELNRLEIEQFSSVPQLNETQQAKYSNMQQMQHEQVHNAQHHVHQGQHTQYNNVDNNYGYPQFVQGHDDSSTGEGAPVDMSMQGRGQVQLPTRDTSDTPGLRGGLGRTQMESRHVSQPVDIAQPRFEPNFTNSEEMDISDLAIDISNSMPEELGDELGSYRVEENVGSSSNGLLSGVPSMLREPLLFLVIFLILSEAVVQENLSKYIPQLNAGSNGTVSRAGVLIMGVILVTLFAISKKLLM